MFPHQQLQQMVNIVPANVAQQIVVVQPIQQIQPIQAMQRVHSAHAFQTAPLGVGNYFLLSNNTIANHQTRVLSTPFVQSNPSYFQRQLNELMNGQVLMNHSLFTAKRARVPSCNVHHNVHQPVITRRVPCSNPYPMPTTHRTTYGTIPATPSASLGECKNRSKNSNVAPSDSAHHPIHTQRPSTRAGDTPSDVYKCDECDRVFVRKVNLNAHKKIHTASAYVCDYCNKKFARKSNLQQHVRIHTDERPYHCTYCPRTFRQQHSLKGHLRTHTGEKPYQCVHCNKRFAAKCNLKVHVRTHTGEKPYQCAPCNKKYASKSGYNAHMRKFHTVDASTNTNNKKRSNDQAIVAI